MTEPEPRYSDQEWGLLVGLPQSVVIAASAVEEDGARATLAESEAGMEAIAEGRESGIPLVEEIAGLLVAQVGDPDEGAEPLVLSFVDREAGIADVLQRAKSAMALLSEKADEGEAGAYRHWLVTIAERVVNAASSGGILGLGGDQVTESEQRFVDRLHLVLQD